MYIIGGGHCRLALSGLANKVGFRVKILDNSEEILNKYDKEIFKTQLLSEYYKSKRRKVKL